MSQRTILKTTKQAIAKVLLESRIRIARQAKRNILDFLVAINPKKAIVNLGTHFTSIITKV